MKFYLLAIAAISLQGVLAGLESENNLEGRNLEGDEFYIEGDFYDESELDDLMGKKKKYGCCYQPWGGDGHGGCSTANWCNRSKKACKTCDGDFYDYEDYYGDELESASNLMGKKKDYECCYQPWGGDGHGGCSTATWCNDSKDNCYSCDGEWKNYKYSDSSEKSKPPKKTKKSETKSYKGTKGCCYQPWGGDGQGGCSTAEWCNYSEDNCDTCDGDFYDESELESASNLMGKKKKKYGCCYQPFGGKKGNGGCSSANWCNYSKKNCKTCDGDFKWKY